MNPVTFQIKPFDALTAFELYELLKLRTDIFVVEQQCPYPELDYKDYKAFHVMMYCKDEMIGCLRLLPRGVSYPEDPSIGRVAIKASFRGKKLGTPLMKQGIGFIKKQWRADSIRISGQLYLKRFYESMSFQQVSEEYLEDGIPHIEMLLELK
ncbi:MAG: GNAT family N-acetyltransferase [Cytophagales bacterium]|nr:GNAT family N-acetyltransferase [Cytophagales bacterium]